MVLCERTMVSNRVTVTRLRYHVMSYSNPLVAGRPRPRATVSGTRRGDSRRRTGWLEEFMKRSTQYSKTGHIYGNSSLTRLFLVNPL